MDRDAVRDAAERLQRLGGPLEVMSRFRNDGSCEFIVRTALLALLPPTADEGQDGEAAARWLCAFAQLDPDDVIADNGGTVLDWVRHHDLPAIKRLLAPSLQDMQAAALSPSPAPAQQEGEAFEIGSRVRPRISGAAVEGTLLEFNEPCSGALIRWDNGDEIWKALRNLEVVR